MRRATPTRLFAVCVLLGGCEFDLDVGPSWHIDTPRVIAVRMVVVEPAPIWEERLGSDDSEVAPIAEALPGDVVELQALTVDGEGRPRASESVDALWFQCGFDGEPDDVEGRCVIDAPPCDSLDEWTTDVACEIGRGDALRFRFPALGPRGFFHRRMPALGVIAREPDVDVEDCRTHILAATNDFASDPERPLPPASKYKYKYEYDSPACSLVEAQLLIGPRWALPFLAEDFGFEPEVPLEQIPYLIVYQPSNRAPAPDQPTWFDADTGVMLQGSPLRVRPNQRVRTTGPNWRDADHQLYAGVDEVDDTGSFVFIGRRETLGAIYLGSGAIREFTPSNNSLVFTVDDGPAPSTIRVMMIVGDRRSNTYSAIGLMVSEFEVVR